LILLFSIYSIIHYLPFKAVNSLYCAVKKLLTYDRR